MGEHRERQELAKRKRIENLIEALTSKKIENNSFVLEQLFQDRYGVLLDYKEIKYFLKQESPSRLINTYISARSWLKFNDSYHHLVPRGFFHGNRFRFIIWPANFLFSIAAMLGILGIIVCVMLVFEGSGLKPIIQTLGITIIALLYAWVFYLALISAESASQLKNITRTSI